MRSQVGKQRRTAVFVSAIVAAILVAVAVTPLMSRAAKPETAPASMALTIVNNTSRDIRHVYFSPSNQDNWGSDQLNSTIAPGGTHTLNNVSCSAADIKVIAEDESGCFLYQIVQCGETASWTIANDAVRDCGN
jgi:hypothetical protein